MTANLYPQLHFGFVSAAVSNAETIFECDFETDTCGMVNDEGHDAKWQRKLMKLGGIQSKAKKFYSYLPF